MVTLPTASDTDMHRNSWGRWGLSVLMIMVFAGFFGMAVALHHPGFHAGVIYDTEALLRGNEHVFSQHDIREVIAIAPQRPLFMASLYANYVVSGMDAQSFRMVNAAILAAAGLALTLLILVLLHNSPVARQLNDRQRVALSILIGLIFVVHPLQRLVVLYIWQREAIMACFFYYAALATYIAGRSGAWGNRIGWYAATSVLVLGGVLCKENVMSFPAVAIVAEWVLFRGTMRHHLRHWATVVLIFVVPFTIQFLVQKAISHAQTPGDLEGTLTRLQSYYGKVELSFPEIVLTECRVWFSYLATIVAPFIQAAQLLRAETVSRSLWSPPTTAVAAIGIMALVGAAMGMTKKHPLRAMGILFFLIALLPESLLIPQYLYCGYRAILPTAGVLMVLADVLAPLFTRQEKWVRQLGVLIPLLVIACFSYTTFSQARKWNPFSVWQEAYAHLPEYSPDVERYPYVDVVSSYASELSGSGQYKVAIELFKEALELGIHRKSDKEALTMGNLGITLLRSGNTEEGIRYLREVVERYPRGAWPRYNLGVALIRTGKREEGIRFIREAIELYPDDAGFRMTLGDLLCESGAYEEAIKEYSSALKLDPRSGKIYTQLGKAWAQAGNRGKALHSYEKALSLKPDFGPALAGLGTMLLDEGRVQEALAYLQKAAPIIGNDAQIFNRLGQALAAQGRTAEALAAFDRALSIEPNHAAARYNREKLQKIRSNGS